ncbi:phosphoribosylglycinamide formyltransferase [Mycoplasma sp. P36-A1]|uniref:phosphoribosylglycinamide formyltransferase n=1 Tax=Mycoplasma sp. P36-A1 TaxID=3252900 RepID=UPI003C2D08C7
MLKNVAVFASGNGSNFQAIADEAISNNLKINIKILVCDKKDAYAITRAKKLNIEVLLVDYKEGKKEVEHKIITELSKLKIDLIILAGFLRILSKDFIIKYKNRIINIHPSALPKYKGLHAIEQALENKDKSLGVTVHYVDEELDNGPIILQEIFSIENLDNQNIYKKVHQIEHQVYIKAIKKVTEE